MANRAAPLADQQPLPPRALLRRRENQFVHLIGSLNKGQAGSPQVATEEVKHRISISFPLLKRSSNLTFHPIGVHYASDRNTQFARRSVKFVDPVKVLLNQGRHPKNVATFRLKTLHDRKCVLLIHVVDQSSNIVQPVINLLDKKGGQSQCPIQGLLASSSLLPQCYAQGQIGGQKSTHRSPSIPVDLASVAWKPALAKAVKETHPPPSLWTRDDSATDSRRPEVAHG